MTRLVNSDQEAREYKKLLAKHQSKTKTTRVPQASAAKAVNQEIHYYGSLDNPLLRNDLTELDPSVLVYREQLEAFFKNPDRPTRFNQDDDSPR
jgi:hypothetical protein